MGILFFLVLLLFPALTCLGQVFTKDREFEYKATYYNKDLNFRTEEKLTLVVTGNRWKYSNSQLEAIWQYNTTKKTRKKLNNLFSIGWHSTDTTGVIENEKKVWLHPPRHNQYTLTEIAPFPEVRKGIKKGGTYSTMLKIGHGFGKWSGKDLIFKYTIVEVNETGGDPIWTISASAEMEASENVCSFTYSDKRGFITITYNFFNGDYLKMELIN